MDATTVAALNAAAEFGVNVTGISRAPGGRTNLNIVIKSGDAQYFLRCYTLPQDTGWCRRLRSRESILYEHQVTAFAASRGIPCVAPLRSPRGETVVEVDGHFYSLFPFIESGSLPADDARTRLAAGFLGGFHNVMREFPVRTQRPQRGFLPLMADWFHLSETDSGRVAEIVDWARRLKPRTDTQKAVARNICYVEEALRVLREDFPFSAYDEFPVVVNHGDFSRGNIGWRDGKIVALFDCDTCSLDLRMADIAGFLWRFIWEDNSVFDMERIRPVVEAYRSENEIAGRELSLCPYLLMARFSYTVLQHLGAIRIRPEANLMVSIIVRAEPIKWALSLRARISSEFAKL